MGNNTSRKTFLPRKFFTVSASATSNISPLNAFDAALMKAGIAQCNLVCVSSILPQDAEYIEKYEITPGTITFCVLARMDGNPGETIGAGIGWGWGVDANGRKYGIVAEAHGYKDKEAIEKELKWKLQEMAKIRGMELSSVNIKSEHFQVPKGKYGSVIVSLVYVPWDTEENEKTSQEEMVKQEIITQQVKEEMTLQ
ncbi:MAG: pyruvoyl-dependent arginine decarboxylase [Candidatus Bathyarchaeota archaeon]